ncbi:MAG: UDP-2,3-diacylglucosamine diphosphatase LpxI [Planctomycetia bacterium]|nr:UDP-2,3-diacylglucosamine diphosphatase LpxI [Planctomycetia bacterium]
METITNACNQQIMNSFTDNSSGSLHGEMIGIIAGWGRFPVAVAEAIKRRGGRTAILSIRDHTDATLQALADEHGTVGVAEIGHAIQFFRRHNATRATMAGKIHKAKLFGRHAWLHHLPDWRGLKTFWPHFISRRRDNRDDSLLRAITAAFDAGGVRICPATVFAPELLAEGGVLAGRPLTTAEEADVAFGWRLAKELGLHDIGQTVVVKNRAPLALEAIEGTDECIRRAGRLCASGGIVVVKVAKPQQDLRFDMPTIGIGTLKSLRAAGARVLAIEAGRTILVDADELADFAVRSDLTIASFFDAAGAPLMRVPTSAAA